MRSKVIRRVVLSNMATRSTTCPPVRGMLFLPQTHTDHQKPPVPRGKNPITSLSLAIISPYYFQSLPIYHLSWDPQSSQKTGQAVMKQIIWSVMELKQKSLLNLSSGICVFTWMPGLLLISDSVFERETTSSDCITIPWFIIYSCFLVQRAFPPPPLPSALLMWWLHSPWAPHHILSCEAWGEGHRRRMLFEWVYSLGDGITTKKACFVWTWTECQLQSRV